TLARIRRLTRSARLLRFPRAASRTPLLHPICPTRMRAIFRQMKLTDIPPATRSRSVDETGLFRRSREFQYQHSIREWQLLRPPVWTSRRSATGRRKSGSSSQRENRVLILHPAALGIHRDRCSVLTGTSGTGRRGSTLHHGRHARTSLATSFRG